MTDRYVRQPDGCCLDTTTGLEWEAESHGPLTWDEAMAYATSLGDGWRVPTRAELLTIVDDTLNDPATTLPGMRPSWYWSSSSSAASASLAWYVYFLNGFVGSYAKSSTYYVRCVHRGSEVTP